MRERLLFIYNPNAGKGKIRTQLADILDIFSASEYEVIVHATTGRGDARRIVKEYASADACDRIVCSGGDGTVNEISGGLMECGKDIPIGYIPAGTMNDFAYSLKMSRNMAQAANCALNGMPFACDMASLNGEYFTYTAAFGIFTNVSYDTPQNVKNALGRVAYFLGGIKQLYEIKKYHVKVIIGKEVIEDDFLYGMLANSNSVGGFKGITGKDVQFDDGFYELVLIRMPNNILGLQAIINDLLTGQFNSDRIYSARIQKAEFISEEGIPWTTDGEFGGCHKEAHIEVYKQAVRFLRDQF